MKHCYNQLGHSRRHRLNHSANGRRDALRELYVVKTEMDYLNGELTVHTASLQEARGRKNKRARRRARRVEREIDVESAAVTMLAPDAFKLSIAIKRMGNGRK
jgi:hypothetical protein